MTRAVLMAWIGSGVATLAILAALFWPMDAELAPLPAADAVEAPAVPIAPFTAPPVVAATSVSQQAAAEARGRVVPTPKPAPAAAAPAAAGPAPAARTAGGAAAAPAARSVATTTTTTTVEQPDNGGGVLGTGNGPQQQPG